jgi:eukaryotic-like serine/threonine-protein kinase
VAVSDASPPLSADSRLGGRYQLVRLVAQGGMAAVWEGHDEILARAVAVKILHPHLAGDQSFLERFKHEAVAAARLSHPNVVATYDAGMAGTGTAFIVMELVRGQTLRQCLTERGPVPPRLAAGIGRQIADALAHAHAAGLIHRDIKPGNVLLDWREGGEMPRVKVTDFGIAKAAEGLGVDLTRTGTVLGTPRYLSPEQIEGVEPDARADLYALGVVLFEMLTGQPPFTGPTDMSTAVQHLNVVPPDVRTLQPATPPAFCDLVRNLLAKRPADRPASAVAVRQILAGIESGVDGGAIAGAVGADATISQAAVTGSPAPPRSGITAIFPPPRQPPTWGNGNGSTKTGRTVPAPGPAASGPPARPRRRANWPGRVVALLVAVAIIVVVVVVADGGSSGHHPTTPPPAAAATVVPISIANVAVFHLERDADNAGLIKYAYDGNPDTAWSTNRYFGPHFAGLRHGLGLAITLNSAQTLHQLKVLSPTQGWSAEVFVAGAVPNPPALAPWGKVVAAQQSISGDATFNLAGAKGSAVLLWLTDLGPSDETAVAELQVS